MISVIQCGLRPEATKSLKSEAIISNQSLSNARPFSLAEFSSYFPEA